MWIMKGQSDQGWHNLLFHHYLHYTSLGGEQESSGGMLDWRCRGIGPEKEILFL